MIPFDAGVDIETKRGEMSDGCVVMTTPIRPLSPQESEQAVSVVVEHFLWPNGSFKFGCLQDLPDMLYSLSLSLSPV